MSDYTDITTRDLLDDEFMTRWSSPDYPNIKVVTCKVFSGEVFYHFFNNIGNLHHVLEFESISGICNNTIYSALIEADKVIKEDYKQYLERF